MSAQTIRVLPERRTKVLPGKITIQSGWDPVLDFDIESRPLGWYGGEWVHQEVTAIASAWIVEGEAKDLEVHTIDKRKGSSEKMLKSFLKRYNEASLVTGHYIRGFDLPQLNSAMLEFDFGPLPDKLTHDTKGDLISFQGLSKSQENLGSILGIEAPKIGMSQNDWRSGNRLTPEGIELVKERVTGDVLQHVQLRQALLDRGFLDAPKVWSPGASSKLPKYQP